MKTIFLLLAVILISLPLSLFAQPLNYKNAVSGGNYPDDQVDNSEPCISDLEYSLLEQRCNSNNKFTHKLLEEQRSALLIPLLWPVQAGNGLMDCNYYRISAYVDHDGASGTFKDYQCGMRTYDGHRGTDIALFPFRFIKMNNDQVRVVAAAGGTILDKADGNADKNCSSNNLQANYLVVGHADGSRALYFHMKKNSLTSKIIGDTVVAGEYLGIVGSSGNSSGPHLHFEVWSGSTVATRIDPFSGSCNLLNGSSWWLSQLAYAEPEVVKASIHTSDIIVPPCPETETSNQKECFVMPYQAAGLPAGFAKYYIFLKNETAGLVATLRVLNPDGSVFSSWNHTSSNNYSTSYWAWTKILPTIPGTYTYEIQYNGKTCSSKFDILNASITPLGNISLCEGDSVGLTASKAGSYLWNTGDTTQHISISNPGSYIVTVTSNFGCSEISEQVMVSVLDLPNAHISVAGSPMLCPGDSVHLMVEAGQSYLWSTGATSNDIVVKLPGEYKVTVTGSNGCTTISDGLVIQQLDPMHGLAIDMAGDSLFSPYGSPNYWYKVGQTLPIDSGEVLVCDQSGEFFVSGIDEQGCRANSDTLFVNCMASAIIINPLFPILQLYPNPTSGTLTISGKGLSNGLWRCKLVNVIGHEIELDQLLVADQELECVLSLDGIAPGAYFLYLESASNRYFVRVFKIDG